jgi:hypothetical protein
MNIQEFSHQLGRDDHPSELIRALRSLRGLTVDHFRQLERWGVWTGGEPRARAERSELPS